MNALYRTRRNGNKNVCLSSTDAPARRQWNRWVGADDLRLDSFTYNKLCVVLQQPLCVATSKTGGVTIIARCRHQRLVISKQVEAKLLGENEQILVR